MTPFDEILEKEMADTPVPSEALEMIEQYVAKGMLLGMVYDPRDHTFNQYSVGSGGPIRMLHADTMIPTGVDTLEHRAELAPGWLKSVPMKIRQVMFVKGLEKARVLG